MSTQPLVLVADDEPRITKLVSIALSEEGFRVVTATGQFVSEFGSGESLLALAVATTLAVATIRPTVQIVPDGSGGYYIRLNGLPCQPYRLQRAPTIIGPWSTSAPQTASASGVVEFHDLFPPSDHAFYRTVQP